MTEATELCLGKVQAEKRRDWFDEDCKIALIRRNKAKIEKDKNNTQDTTENIKWQEENEASGSVKTVSSKMPETDAETLRKELTILGFNPGPITATTVRVYLKKLHQLRKELPHIHEPHSKTESKRVDSPELEATLKNPSWTTDLSAYKLLEDALLNDFSSPFTTGKWREGNSKSSFAYLLLDPRKTDNLPCRADTMDSKEVWETFLSSIFYVGKGKKNRPFSHLYDAVTHYRQNKPVPPNHKLKTILDIWNNRLGVICLFIFHNIIPVEAYTREAAMIKALRKENVSNMKIGEFYGTASTWKPKKCMLGTYLLHKAMNIYLQEGERQLSLNDIECW
uniref:Ankyrin repeat and LEM domain-containing protein 1-like n=1 Tax=Diabrotica virgifera virgifera TaxID=50390 RepID=A0A6P7GND8_DIAVI